MSREGLSVQEVTVEEGNKLLRIVRRSSGSVVTWRRAQMVLLSVHGDGRRLRSNLVGGLKHLPLKLTPKESRPPGLSERGRWPTEPEEHVDADRCRLPLV